MRKSYVIKTFHFDRLLFFNFFLTALTTDCQASFVRLSDQMNFARESFNDRSVSLVYLSLA